MKIKNKFFLLLCFISGVLCSCGTNFHMEFPQGPQGIPGNDGLSAYEVWVNEVNKGTINWDKNYTDINNFFLYLKGKDGTNGIDGNSAYALWVIEVLKGLEHPYYPGTNWDKNKTSMVDFFDYLRGAKGADGKDGENGKDGVDGKSAYELWVIDVQKGLDNPHDPGVNWPYNEITMNDFYRYLRGKDGNDGKDGQTGQPGVTIKVIEGVPNVICQYQKQEYNEFVRESDGAVVYKVYTETGLPASNAIVQGLPGIDPDKIYTADINGEFIVPKEDLPLDLPSINRNGSTTSVTYTNYDNDVVTEQSAPNTYVPLRVQMRIRLTSAPTISSSAGNIYLSYVIERRIDPNLAWERIPSYLGNLSQPIKVYELSDSSDPKSFTSTSKLYYNSSQNISTTTNINVGRLTKRCEYLTLSYQTNSLRLWDEKDHYMALVLDSYYGESPNAGVVIKMAPIQLMPLIKNVQAGTYTVSNSTFASIEGVFDTSDIDYTLLFDNSYSSVNKSGYVYYEPIITTKSAADTKLVFSITFAKTVSNVSWTVTNSTKSSIINPAWSIPIDVYNGASVTIGSNITGMFYTPSAIGTIIGSGTTFTIQGTNNSNYIVPNIPITLK